MIALASIARLLVTVFWLASAAFGFLSSVPFAYEQFIAPRLVPGLVEFAEIHRWIALALLPVTWLGLAARLDHPRARAVARLTLGVAALAAIGLPLAPPLARLQPNTWAVVACLVSLIVPLRPLLKVIVSGVPPLALASSTASRSVQVALQVPSPGSTSELTSKSFAEAGDGPRATAPRAAAAATPARRRLRRSRRRLSLIIDRADICLVASPRIVSALSIAAGREPSKAPKPVVVPISPRRTRPLD